MYQILPCLRTRPFLKCKIQLRGNKQGINKTELLVSVKRSHFSRAGTIVKSCILAQPSPPQWEAAITMQPRVLKQDIFPPVALLMHALGDVTAGRLTPANAQSCAALFPGLTPHTTTSQPVRGAVSNTEIQMMKGFGSSKKGGSLCVCVCGGGKRQV